jgi:PhzF family phenazine biosynthesis protein
MNLTIYQVDAFTKEAFKGNPAAVCPLESWISDDMMQKIALENNLSETAFFVKKGDLYELRWFTPTFEIDLCGHATLATAFVIFNELSSDEKVLKFETMSGMLSVEKEDDLLILDFPSRPPVACEIPEGMIECIGKYPEEILKSRDYFLVFETEQDVLDIQPNFTELLKLPTTAIIVTAKGTDADFVSRCFAPEVGVFEDPVTGSAHCNLIPYWAEKLGKEKFFARQVSARGGELFCELKGDRVKIGGNAVLFMKGEIFV